MALTANAWQYIHKSVEERKKISGRKQLKIWKQTKDRKGRI